MNTIIFMISLCYRLVWSFSALVFLTFNWKNGNEFKIFKNKGRKRHETTNIQFFLYLIDYSNRHVNVLGLL